MLVSRQRMIKHCVKYLSIIFVVIFNFTVIDIILAQNREVYFCNSACSAGDWIYFCNSACSVGDWVYFTSSPSTIATWVYLTNNCEDANIQITNNASATADWIYLCSSACSVGDWIYICNSTCSVGEWIYLTNSPKNADVTICLDEDALLSDFSFDEREEMLKKYVAAILHKDLFKSEDE